MLGSIGMTELLVILAIFILIFGASKIPQLGKGLGEGIRNFKKGLKGDDETASRQQLSETSPPSSKEQTP